MTARKEYCVLYIPACGYVYVTRTCTFAVQCMYTVFPRKDVVATIYFSSTAIRRLFEGGYYSKYRRRGYYLFQLYHNTASFRGWLLFEVQTSRLLFISALPQCAMRQLFEGGFYSKYRHRGYYSRAATIRSTDVAATIYFSSTTMRNAATIRGRLLFKVQTSRLLFISALPQCGNYSRAATIRGAAFIRENTVYHRVGRLYK